MWKTILYLLIFGCSLICLSSATHEASLAGHPCYTAWAVREWKQVQNIGGITLTGDDRNTATETCASVALFTTNITLTDQGSNPGLRALMPANDGLRIEQYVRGSSQSNGMGVFEAQSHPSKTHSCFCIYL
jgi:hypothetical protein